MIKISPWRIIVAHIKTFGDVDREKRISDVLFFYVQPLLFGGGYWALARFCKLKSIPDHIWDGCLTVAAIFIPLIFTLIATLLGTAKDFKEGTNEKRLLQEVVDSSAYVIFTSLLLVVLIFLADWYYPVNAPRKVGNALFVYFVCHIFLTTLMILRRFHCLAEKVLSPNKKGEHL